MRNVPKSFYQSQAWQNTRELYLLSVNGLCEDCLDKGIYTPAEHIHHIKHLNADNVNNPEFVFLQVFMRIIWQLRIILRSIIRHKIEVKTNDW